MLLTEDERWADRAAEPAYYVHNLVTSPAVPGAGRRILEEIERLGRDAGKCALRLDCAVDNAFLNAYYESGGYLPCGRCQDGSYCGNRREKRLSGGSC